MNKDQVGKNHQTKNILMGDQSTGRFNWQYEDHITAIVRRAEGEGQFDGVKGKKIIFDSDLSYNPEKALNKVLKDNGVLPRWMELKKEIDHLKSELELFNDKPNIQRTIEMINKKVMDYNLSCPRTSQMGGINLEKHLRQRGMS